LRGGKIIAVSQYAKHAMTHSKLNVIPIPIDTTLFSPAPDKVQPGLLCFTGRFLDPRKNIHFLFEVFSIVLKKIPSAQLYLIGDDVTPEIIEQLNQLNIKSHMTVLNYIPLSELVTILQKTDVFIIPSRQEGLCVSGLEAMACGCPVVSTKCGGPNDYIIDGENGYLIDFNPTECSEKIISIIQNRALRTRMSQHAIKTIHENYHIDRFQEKWVQLIQEFTL